MQEPEARAVPMFSIDFSQDLGRIEPHKGRFPAAFEEALFFLLLASWESWSTILEGDWRGFRVPWVPYRRQRSLRAAERPAVAEHAELARLCLR